MPPADLYLLRFILHDWNDEDCVRILRNCRAALNPGGRIAVIELLVGDLSPPGPAALQDMNMLAVAPGRERTLSEYDASMSGRRVLRKV